MPISSSSSLVTFTCRGPSQWWSLGPPMKNHLSRSARPLTCPYLTSPPPALQKTAPPLPHRLPGNPTANCTARCTHRGTIQASLGQANKVKPNLLAAWLPVCLSARPLSAWRPGLYPYCGIAPEHTIALPPHATQRNATARIILDFTVQQPTDEPLIMWQRGSLNGSYTSSSGPRYPVKDYEAAMPNPNGFLPHRAYWPAKLLQS